MNHTTGGGRAEGDMTKEVKMEPKMRVKGCQGAQPGEREQMGGSGRKLQKNLKGKVGGRNERKQCRKSVEEKQ